MILEFSLGGISPLAHFGYITPGTALGEVRAPGLAAALFQGSGGAVADWRWALMALEAWRQAAIAPYHLLPQGYI